MNVRTWLARLAVVLLIVALMSALSGCRSSGARAPGPAESEVIIKPQDDLWR